jgi:hypothetical protein
MSNTAGAEMLDGNGSKRRITEPAQNVATESAKAIPGAWRPLAIEDRKPDGEIIYRMGRKPDGLIVFDASGCLSVQFMRDPRPVFRR